MRKPASNCSIGGAARASRIALGAWPGVIATTLGSLAIVLTLFYSAYSFSTTLREGYYAELDRMYFELLKIGLGQFWKDLEIDGVVAKERLVLV